MLTKNVVYNGGFQAKQAQGDIVAGSETTTSLATAGAGTILGTLLASTLFSRTGPTGAVNDTTDTATAIIAALSNGSIIPSPGDTYRWRYINNVAFAITVVAGTGVTVTNGIVNASSVKDFLITLVNTTPSSISVGATTNGSATITGMGLKDTTAVSVGMAVTGTGIPGSTTVIGVTPGVGVTLSANATATASIVALTFTPAVTLLGIGQGLL